CVQKLDLAIVCEKEILKAAGVSSAQRMRETMDNEFFKEFMKRIIRNNKTVYLLGDTSVKILELQEFLQNNYEKLKICGSYALEDCTGDFDNIINETNIAEPDLIFSVISTPEQEYFLKDNVGKFNAKIWYGLGNDYAGKKGVSEVRKFAKKMLHKGMLHSMLSRYNKEE
ncbi:MAG: WecB/TagA/CpsF family glycosyltransferase, partial [Lachnospiraceae bacterium]